MRRPHTLMLALAMASLACASDTIVGTAFSASPDQPRQVVSLTGFVVLYGEGDVRLLTGGKEIQLFGATESVIQYGGLEVRVDGQFLDAGHFWVLDVTLLSRASDPPTDPASSRLRAEYSRASSSG